MNSTYLQNHDQLRRMMKMLSQVVVLFLLARASFVQSFCTNSWAVDVHGRREVAKKVALKHGFELRENVSCKFAYNC